jgi:hypothetical protein
MGNHFSQIARLQTDGIDSNTANEYGFNGTAKGRTLDSEEKIY